MRGDKIYSNFSNFTIWIPATKQQNPGTSLEGYILLTLAEDIRRNFFTALCPTGVTSITYVCTLTQGPMG